MTTHHRISGILATGALALGVSAMPASARTFDINASGAVVPTAVAAAAAQANSRTPEACGDVCSGGYGTATPAAAAQANSRTPEACGDVCSGGYFTATPAASTTTETGARLPHAGRTGPLTPATAYNTAPAPRTVVRVVTHGSGFHWGDAGIGAAGFLALSILGIGGVMAFSQRRIRRGEAPVTT